MSRHNRRRTRGGHAQKAINSTFPPSNNNMILMNNAGGMAPYMLSYHTVPQILPPLQPPQHILTRRLPPPPPGLNPPLWASAPFSTLGTLSGPGLPAPFSKPPNSTRPTSNARTGISARHWHNRYMAWQAREKRQREESVRLQAEKVRIFGYAGGGAAAAAAAGAGDEDQLLETGYGRDVAATAAAAAFEDEDEELCKKMLEYFGRLDFIEW